MQQTSLLNFFGVRPNLALVVLLAMIFVTKDWVSYLILVLTASLLLKSTPIWDKTVIVFLLVVAGSYLLEKVLPWRPIFSSLVLIISATTLFALASAALSGTNPQGFLGQELLYNLILGVAALAVLSFIYQYNVPSRTSF